MTLETTHPQDANLSPDRTTRLIAGGGGGFWPGLRGAHGCRPYAGAGFGGHLLLERHGRHQLFCRPRARPAGRDDGAGTEPARLVPAVVPKSGRRLRGGLSRAVGLRYSHFNYCYGPSMAIRELHRDRLIDHIGLVVRNLATTRSLCWIRMATLSRPCCKLNPGGARLSVRIVR